MVSLFANESKYINMKFEICGLVLVEYKLKLVFNQLYIAIVSFKLLLPFE